MHFSEKRIYTTFIVLCAAGYAWFVYALFAIKNLGLPQTVCPFKAVTKIACPTCGTSHAVQALFSGDIILAMQINPLGVFSGLFLLVIPAWIAFDVMTRKETFAHAYIKVTLQLQKKGIFFTILLLGILHWIWNIYKNI